MRTLQRSQAEVVAGGAGHQVRLRGPALPPQQHGHHLQVKRREAPSSNDSLIQGCFSSFDPILRR